MKKLLFIFAITSLYLILHPVFAQNAGYFAGGFADGLNRGMASGANSAAIAQAIAQQRVENRRQYGTREIQQMNAMEKDADNRLREIFRELSSPGNQDLQKRQL